MPIDATSQANALIHSINRQQAGRLTVFLGAAPGVGKTYAMLNRAHELLRQGSDVVVGIVETHGRKDTQALLDGLPMLPLQYLPYQGKKLAEMDLDAILAKRPQIVLVDELAHRNVPGSRHERRWQDVEELLDAGMDVYTTMNIQHLESLNDVVYQITGIRVSETVPDTVFARLRDMRLVDLPVQELIERLNQGKVYLPDQAQQALQGFFTPSNLTALRELAMQTVASHVDADLRERFSAQGLAAIPLKNHVMIGIDGRGTSEYLVRAGRRMAERRGALWTVVTVANEQTGQRIEQQQLELDRAFALARRLGGNTTVVQGTDIAQTLLDTATIHNVTAIVIGRTRQRPWATLLGKTLSQRLLKHGTAYELTIVAAPQDQLFTSSTRSSSKVNWHTLPKKTWSETGFVLLATLLGIGLAMLADRWLGLQDLSIIFIVTVLVVASRTRMLAAVTSAILCFLAYNFFFISPRLTLEISAPRGVVTVLTFLAAALIAGRLASRLRMQVMALRVSNTHTIALQELGRRLSTAADLGQVMQVGQATLQQTLQAEACLQIDQQTVPAGLNAPLLNEREQIAANWCMQHGKACGRYTDTLSSINWWFLPITVDRQTIGVAGLRFSMAHDKLSFEQRRLAEAMVEDIAQAALRTRLVSDLESARVTTETEKLRSALLSSVSHDLRSPLAAIIGSADSLVNYGHAMTTSDQQELLRTIRMEGERLDRYIQNLLDMTRLGHQGLTLSRDWIGVDELIGSATRRLQHYQPEAHFTIDIPSDLPPLFVHPALIEQAIFNVLENATKFSPKDEPVSIAVSYQPETQTMMIDIADQGAGIPEEQRSRIFDMFYSMERGDRGQQGTGLGLTIVKAIIGAHMGSIEALAGKRGVGTLIRITLPHQPAA